MDNVGTLPDFGNFCMADEGYGSVFDGTCATIYDFYKGVEEMMPKAFAVSAKSNDFDENGDEHNVNIIYNNAPPTTTQTSVHNVNAHNDNLQNIFLLHLSGMKTTIIVKMKTLNKMRM